tara:strand:+ start:94 stop:231 length:138 start_codon:yes stop_codon:yes gene_type:complete
MKPLNKSDWINDDLVKKRLDKVWEVEGDYFKAEIFAEDNELESWE